jgi:hypothetical protein
MNPQRFAQCNTVMTAPDGMANCVDVHAFTDGRSVCITAWKPTPEELVKLNLGQPVYLWVYASGLMVPAAVTVDDPFDSEVKPDEH